MVTLVNGRPIHVARKISPEIKFGDARVKFEQGAYARQATSSDQYAVHL